jgi:hypothetical protein
MEDPGSWLLARRQLFNLIAALCVLVVAARLKATRQPLAWLGARIERLQRLRGLRLPALFSVVFFAMACTLSGLLFSHLPHIPDSQLHYVAAKLFASGHLTAPAHPAQHLFPLQYLGVRDGMIYSSYPPGHTVFVALFTLFGLPWLTNPLMGALFVLAVYALAREAGGHTTGLIASTLTLVCTFVVFMSSEFMSLPWLLRHHPPALRSAADTVLRARRAAVWLARNGKQVSPACLHGGLRASVFPFLPVV